MQKLKKIKTEEIGMAARQPTKVLEMRGSFKDNPGRKKDRKNEPQVFQPMPKEPPEHLLVREKKVWREQIANFPPGVIDKIDGIVFETLIVLFTKFRYTRGKLTAAELSQMIRCAQTLGMTPVDRSRIIQAPPPKGKDSWDDA